MKVYVSEFGKVIVGEVVKETPKGFRIKVDRWNTGRMMEYLVYNICPNGNHKTFLDKDSAISDATSFIDAKEAKALLEIEKCTELYNNLFAI